jgi:KEOPS complex subunit Pcc1
VHETLLQFDYDDAARARVVERSVRREVEPLADERSRVALERDGATLEVHVEAADIVGLRAASNTWQGLVGAAEGVAEAAGGRA